MNSSNYTTRIAGGALLFCAMAFVGWQIQRGSQKNSDPPTEIRQNRTSDRVRRPSNQNNKGLAGAKRLLRVIDAEKNPAERMRVTTALVNSLSTDELLEWLDKRWFTCRDGYELSLFSRLATERLSHEDPLRLLAWSMKDNSSGSEAALKTLTESDPQALIDFFKENPKPYLELRALGAISKNNPEMAMDRLIEISLTGKDADFGYYYINSAMTTMAESSPELLEAKIAELGGKFQKTAQAALLGAKLNRSFATELDKLIDQPDGLNQLKAACATSRTSISDSLLANLGRLPSSWQAAVLKNNSDFLNNTNAYQWLTADLEGAGVTSSDANLIRLDCINNLAYSNPKQALEGYQHLDPSTMDASQKISILQAIFSTQSNPLAATGLLNMLDSDEDRMIAQKAIPSNPNESDLYKLRNTTNSSDWLDQVKQLNTNTTSDIQYYLTESLQKMNKQQIAELSKDFQSLPEDARRNVANVLTSSYTRNEGIDPELKGQALDYLISNPVAQGTDSNSGTNLPMLASIHVTQWIQTDPKAATDWTSKLPDSDAKTWATKNLASTWMQYDPAAAQKWIQSLPSQTQQDVQNFIDSSK
ncbi:hypothetical protein JIN85_00705 [Luteolibacter pohnpeiensis]|uniref:Uncharacterized protein n=1 Tax=Luteolibacter pohnpeiensis TaxID=454153 RepID=A0A934VU99_9BACT|nr:hypothetical protein [Luteolibacter pohnpeiensis]MBK1880910.1 hypothetical protein [Luteolibacter pohnpeiensis]